MRSDISLDEACELIVDCPHKTAPESPEPYAFAVGTKAIVKGGIDFGKARPVSRETYESWIARAVPRAGDLILCREAPVGPVAEVPANPPVCLGQRTVLLRPDPGRADTRYLKYLLLAPTSQASLRSLSEGSTVAHLNVADVRRFHVALPDVNEQRRIAAILSALDDKIDSNFRLLARLSELAQVEFRHRFGGSIEGVDSLGDHVTVVRGRSYKSRELADGDRALVTLKSIRAGGGYDPGGLKPYIGDFKPEQVVQPGELVVAHTDLTQSAAVVGKPALVPDKGGFAELIASLDLAVVRPASARVSVPFLYHLLLEPAFQQHAYGYANGSTVLHLSKEAIPAFPIDLPEPHELAEYDALAQPVLDQANGLTVESRSLAAARDALLPKLVSGQIRVPDTAEPEEVIGPAAEDATAAV